VSVVNRLAAVLEAQDVKVDVPAESTPALFGEAALLLKHHSWAGALSTVTDTLLERERLASTCLGHGVAIPHGRLKELKTAVAGVIRVREPLPFGGPDDEPVTLFIFLFVPERATQSDLEILGEIAEMLSDKDVRERLTQAGDATDVYATIADWVPGVTTARIRR
jgi:PTS system nitrogen regulatory IIA component